MKPNGIMKKHRCCTLIWQRVCCHQGLNSWPRAWYSIPMFRARAILDSWVVSCERMTSKMRRMVFGKMLRIDKSWHHSFSPQNWPTQNLDENQLSWHYVSLVQWTRNKFEGRWFEHWKGPFACPIKPPIWFVMDFSKLLNANINRSGNCFLKWTKLVCFSFIFEQKYKKKTSATEKLLKVFFMLFLDGRPTIISTP